MHVDTWVDAWEVEEVGARRVLESLIGPGLGAVVQKAFFVLLGREGEDGAQVTLRELAWHGVEGAAEWR